MSVYDVVNVGVSQVRYGFAEFVMCDGWCLPCLIEGTEITRPIDVERWSYVRIQGDRLAYCPWLLNYEAVAMPVSCTCSCHGLL